MPPSARTQRLFDLWGVALVAAGVIANLNNLYKELSPYDESILLLNAWLMNGGAVPYRDFYSNYPPGAFALLAVCFKVFGTHVLTERVLGLLLRATIAGLAGRLAGQLRGRAYSFIPAGLALIWLSYLDLTALAFLFGAAWALAAATLFMRARQRKSRGSWLLVGACFGIGSYFRHDLLIWSAVILACIGSVWWLAVHHQKLAPSHARALGFTALGATVVEAALWGPVFARAGRQVLDDLLFDQVRYVLPGRVLPMPPLFTLSIPNGPGSVGFPFPNALHELAESAMFIVLLGPAAALLAFALARRLGLDRPLLCVLAALSLAAFPQLLGRTDMPHAIYGMVPALVLLWTLAEAFAAKLQPRLTWLPLILAFAFLSYAPRGVVRWRVKIKPKVPVMQNARGSGVIALPFRDELVRSIQQHTRPGEPIFVGLTDHRTTPGNELDLYFLSERPGSTRYLQFDPNIANRRDVQEQMIRELEAKKTRLVIVSSTFVGGDEPNSSSVPGSDVLDKYLAANFHTVEKFDHWEVRLRN